MWHSGASRIYMMNSVKLRSKKTISPSEADIENTCTDWLALDGWRSLRTDPQWMRGLAVLEVGIADRLYLRYPTGDHPHNNILWIEWKKRGAKARSHQQDWHKLERMRGAMVLVAGVDFVASIEGFQLFYRNSGFMRRKI